MSELKSVALWHPNQAAFAEWYDWFTALGWMVIDVGESVEEVPEVGIWLIAWNEQFHRPKLRFEFERRRRKFPKEVWCATVARSQFDEISLDELSLYGIDEVFAEQPERDDYVAERLDLALRSALAPASRHRVRTVLQIGMKENLAEAISILTGQLMRETDLKALTFWLMSPAQGMRAWLRRSEDRIESLAGSVQMESWEISPGDQWGLPRRSRAHRWQMQTKDEMAWWLPLTFERRVIGYLELVFPSSISADIEIGTLRVREWAPALVAILQSRSSSVKSNSVSDGSSSSLSTAHLLIDCARRAHRPLSVISFRGSGFDEAWLSSLMLRTSDLVVTRNAHNHLIVMPETTTLSALTFLTRISSKWDAFEEVGVASLHEHGVSLDDLVKHAAAQPLWRRADSADALRWSPFSRGTVEEAVAHLTRIFRTTSVGEGGKLLVIGDDTTLRSLVELPSNWEGVFVSSNLDTEIPLGWNWVRSAREPREIEALVVASDGTYGFRGRSGPELVQNDWQHTSNPRLVLGRWSQLTTEHLLGED